MNAWVFFFMEAVLTAGVSGASTKNLDPLVLLEKFQSCNKELQTIYYELETSRKFGGSTPGKREHSLKYCSNNGKKQWIGYRTTYNQDGTVRESSSGFLKDIYGDEIGVHLGFYNPKSHSRPPRATLYRSSRESALESYIEHPPYGGPLSGRLYGSNNQSVYDLLKAASNLKLADKAERIIGHDAYLIEADTPYGVVRAWVAPDLNGNCLKWEIVKNPNQFHRDGQFVSGEFTEWIAVFDAERVEQIDGKYVVTQAKFYRHAKDGDKVITNATFHYTLKNIDFEPDFQALGAFKIHLPEKTVVRDVDFPRVKYQWIGGKLQPLIDEIIVEALDNAVAGIRENGNAVPARQVGTPEGDGAVTQVERIDGKQLANPNITGMKEQRK